MADSPNDSNGRDTSEKADKKATAADLFGDDSDENDAVSGTEEQNDAQPQSQASQEHAQRTHVSEKDLFGDFSDDDEDGAAEGAREEEAVEEEPEEIVERSVSHANKFGSEVFYMRMPNFLSVKAEPFDPENYTEEYSTEKVINNEGQERLKLKVENSIRYRIVKGSDGTERMETNGRFVRWSDNSMTFHLGKEVFEVLQKDITAENMQLYSAQPLGTEEDMSLIYLAQAPLPTKLSFRPMSTKSETHKKLTVALADRFIKTSKVRIMTETMAPQAHKDQQIKAEDERIRAKQKLVEKRQKVADDYSERKKLTTDFLEDNDEVDEEEEEEEEEEKETYSNFRTTRRTARDDEAEKKRLNDAKKATESDAGAGGKRGSAGAAKGATKRRRTQRVDESDEDDEDADAVVDESEEEAKADKRGKGKRRRVALSDDDD